MCTLHKIQNIFCTGCTKTFLERRKDEEMKTANDTTKALAQKMNVSRSTVSRALRHCGGVDTDLRNEILRAAAESGNCSTEACDIYVILPQVPKYFWQRAYDGTARQNCEPYRMKLNICTKSTDSETALLYLDEAERMGARVIIIAMQAAGVLRDRLETLAKDRLVILLTEYFENKNCFYVGGDPREEGRAVGKLWREHYADSEPIILDFYENTNPSLRIDGFTREIADLRVEPQRLRIPNETYSNMKTAPSQIARMLFGNPIFNQKSKRSCIYCPNGGFDISLAIYKLKLAVPPICICHDVSTVGDPDFADAPSTRCDTVCIQDVYAQAKRATELAIAYLDGIPLPKSKSIIIPPKIGLTRSI